MSFFKVICPWCEQAYWTGVVGSTLMGSHDCPRKNNRCPCGADSLSTGEHIFSCPNHPLNLYSGRPR